MGNKIVELGSFDVTGTKIRVSDPCYEPGTWCAGEINNIKPGKWEAAVVRSDEGPWGIRNAVLIARHTDGGPAFFSEAVPDRTWGLLTIDVGVDSGQAGIYDAAHYQDDTVCAGQKTEPNYGSPWYNVNCDCTMSGIGAGVIPYGVVSSSGYGDGSYAAYCHYGADRHIDGVCIVFIEEEA